MACINPLDIFVKRVNKTSQSFKVPCGHCLNCMIKKQSALEFLAKKELLTNYLQGKGAAFVTLTYDDNHLPFNDEGYITLRRSDVQKFIKNMRRQMEYYNINTPFKYIYCGELGSDTSRPHYHIIFFGLTDTEVSMYTRKLWKHGLCDVGVLAQGGIRYVLKYMTKALPSKEIKELREKFKVENPFVYHSIGMGKDWINKHLQEIVDNEFTFSLNGKRYLYPKYVMRYVSNHTGVDYHESVKNFLSSEVLPLAKKNGKSFEDYTFEDSFIRYKNNVACLRSKNIPVDDISLNKKWVKPKTNYDRNPYIEKMADLAYYGDVVPF